MRKSASRVSVSVSFRVADAVSAGRKSRQSAGLDLLNGGKVAGQEAGGCTARIYHTLNDVSNPHWDYSGIPNAV